MGMAGDTSSSVLSSSFDYDISTIRCILEPYSRKAPTYLTSLDADAIPILASLYANVNAVFASLFINDICASANSDGPNSDGICAFFLNTFKGVPWNSHGNASPNYASQLFVAALYADGRL